MCRFGKEDILANIFLNKTCILATLKFFFDKIGSIYKIEPILPFTNKVLFPPTSNAKMPSCD